MKKIPYIANSVLTNLQDSVDLNIERYETGNFDDLAANARWKATLDIEYDDTLLSKLNHDPNKTANENDRINSEIIGNVFKNLTPQLACREEIWARLSHIECLEYSRQRWLKGIHRDKLAASIRLHMFAAGRPNRRNNHSISRLWWTYHLAKSVRPSDPKSALIAITQSVDLRKSIFDNPWTTSRLDITRGIVDIIEARPEISKEKNWREFIKIVNRSGGGKVFEVMSSTDISKTLNQCAEVALT